MSLIINRLVYTVTRGIYATCECCLLVSCPAGKKFGGKIRLVTLRTILIQFFTSSGRNLHVPIEALHFIIIAIQKMGGVHELHVDSFTILASMWL